MKQAFLLNPIPADWYYNDLGLALYYSGRYEEAASNLEEAVKRMPGWPLPHYVLIGTYMALGRIGEARNLGSEFLKKFPNFSLDRDYETWPMKDREAWDMFYARLKEAGLK
ncbi:MAG: tetratricopeptide repeat protein [SAR324 cluster bacterium]|nr:tetratricopeptide repeat protein [SAR324 cluster bacterium]